MRILTISDSLGSALDDSAGGDRPRSEAAWSDLEAGGYDAALVHAATLEHPEMLLRVRAQRPTTAVVARCADEEQLRMLLVGVDATCGLDDDPATLRQVLGAAHEARVDRMRWPRALAERRVLILASSDEGSALVEAAAEAGFAGQLVTTVSAAITLLRHSEYHVVLMRHDDPAAVATLCRAVRGFDLGLGLALVVEDEAQAEALSEADSLIFPPLDVDGLGAALERAWLRWARHRASIAPTVLAVGVDEERRPALLPPSDALAPWRVQAVDDLSAALAHLSEEPVAAVVAASGLPLRSLVTLRTQTTAPIALWEEQSGQERATRARAFADAVIGADTEPSSCRATLAALVDRGREGALFARVSRRLREVDARRIRLIEQVADAQAELERLETVDHVTETLNRRGLELVLQRSLAAARRAGGGVAACLVDCDDFLRTERHYGRGSGDRVIFAVARRIEDTLRQTDVMGRVGVDTFLLLMPRTRLAEAGLVAERARVAVSSKALEIEDGAVQASVSAGVVAVPWETTSLEEVIASAEIALAASKAAGKDRVLGGEASVGEEMRQMVADLVSGEALRTVAQPIFRLDDDEVVAYEMLSRGREGLFEAPEQFLRVARDKGVLTAVDLQCLRSCLSEAKMVSGGFTVHLNLFPTTLLDSSIEELVGMLCEPEAPICLELSEEQFVGDPRKLVERVSALRSAGIRLAIDDVGKGRGTLDSVMILEPEVVKIDKDLIVGASRDVRRERLLRRLVALATALGAEVIAEGVETEADLDLVRELEVPFAQGFFWAEPGRYGEI